MKRVISLVLTLILVIVSSCNFNIRADDDLDNDYARIELSREYKNLNDSDLLRYLEDSIYSQVVNTLNSDDYYVENVSAVYISKEYIEELEFNSRANLYFGYTLTELYEQFEGNKYIFFLGDDGKTNVKEVENTPENEYSDVLKNVIVGSGVILICVTVSAVTAGTAPAISMIFAASAKTGTTVAISSGAIGGVGAAIITGIQTGDLSKATEAGIVTASEGFKWGAISGVLAGGVKEMSALRGATSGGLSMNEAAKIQKESGYPLDVIKGFRNVEQYEECKRIGLQPKMVDGKLSLVREIDLEYVDVEKGLSNFQRMEKGMPPLDPSGKAYELHHLGQQSDSTLAILTKAEHMQNGNNKLWHVFDGTNVDHGAAWQEQKERFWQFFVAEAAKSGGKI